MSVEAASGRGKGPASKRSTRQPREASASAADTPNTPPPTTIACFMPLVINHPGPFRMASHTVDSHRSLRGMLMKDSARKLLTAFAVLVAIAVAGTDALFALQVPEQDGTVRRAGRRRHGKRDGRRHDACRLPPPGGQGALRVGGVPRDPRPGLAGPPRSPVGRAAARRGKGHPVAGHPWGHGRLARRLSSDVHRGEARAAPGRRRGARLGRRRFGPADRRRLADRVQPGDQGNSGVRASATCSRSATAI